MQGLLTRALTGFVFAGIIIGGIYGNRYSFVLLFAIITALCLWEFLNLVLLKEARRDLLRKFIGVCLGLIPFLLAAIVQLELIKDKKDFVALLAFSVFPFIFLAFIYELYTKSERPFTNIAFIVLGMIYIGVPFGLLEFIAFDKENFYPNTVLGLLFMNWANDSGAYLVGSRFGKTPLFPRISPKKTWEGSFGGLIFTFVMMLCLYQFINELRLVDWIALASIVVVFGTFGDLIESMFKRSLQIKDSGTLLPGHGGVLDRFDAFIFLLPFATAYLLWVR